MPLRRIGRPGLVGTMARTAVIAGTATAVSGGVQRRSAQRRYEKDAAQQNEQAQAQGPQPVQQAPSAADPEMEKLRELGEMHTQGILSDEEFAAAKAKVLGI